MENHEAKLPATLMQSQDIVALLGRAVPRSPLTRAQAEAILGSKKASERTIVEVLRSLGIEFTYKHPAAELLEKYFQEVYTHSIDLRGIEFPEKEGFTTFMVAPPELDEDRIMECVTEHFKVRSISWITPITENIRRKNVQKRPWGPHVFSHRGGDEPDDIHRGKSHYLSMEEGFPFANVKEYLLMTGFHRYLKGYFMDKEGLTHTSSEWSRCTDVVNGNSKPDLWISGDDSGYSRPDTGPRELFFGNFPL